MAKATETSIDRDIFALQQDAAHGKVAVSALLRRALLLARAKKDSEAEAWIRKEIEGYDPFDKNVPNYRKVPCTLHALNPYRGWLAVQFVEPKDAERWSSRFEVGPIEAVEQVAEAARNGSGNLRMNLWQEAEAELARTSNMPYSGHTQFVPASAIECILSTVRTRLLDWTMQFDYVGHRLEVGSTTMDNRAKRFQFLAALHDAVEGNRSRRVNMFEVGKSLGFDRKDTELVVQFLVGEAMVEHRTIGGGIGITHHGVREVEDARSEPLKPTEYFPPSGTVPAPPSSVTNIVNNYGTMGWVQQAGSDSMQAITHDERGKITHVLEQVKAAAAIAELDPTVKGDVAAQVGTVEAQLRASQPRMNIVRGCLQSLREILESAAGQALGAALPGILKGLGGLLGG